jgi:hypothetical protein
MRGLPTSHTLLLIERKKNGEKKRKKIEIGELKKLFRKQEQERKQRRYALGDHVSTCTSHSGAKKAHDWTVDQLDDQFLTTHKVKTQQVVRSWGH